MNPVIEIKDKRAIQEDAALWIITMDNRPLSHEEQMRLRTWLLASASHRKEFIDLARVWGQLDLLAHYGLDVIGDDPVSSAPEKNAHTPHRQRWAGVAIAASLALCAFGFVLANRPLNMPVENFSAKTAPLEAQLFTTAIGELRDIHLSDGSVIKLNTNTRIRVQMGSVERRIELVQGEANFIVAKDTKRPFVVYTPAGRVTAVGTAFNIRMDQGAANVLVTEGVISVTPLEPHLASGIKQLATKARDLVATPETNLKVSAGHRVQLSEKNSTAINKVEKKLVEQELSWHSGMLSFSNTPLQQVIAEVSRYTSMKIVIDDPEIARMPVGGYFKAGEIPAMLEVLQLSFGIKVTRLSNATILLSNNSAPSRFATPSSTRQQSFDTSDSHKSSP